MDELRISNLLTRYAHAVDSQDWDLYRSVFTDDAHVDYSAAGMVTGSIDQAVEFLRPQQAAIGMGMHYVTNVESHISGDTADVIAMWFSAVQLPGITETRFFGGRWRHDMVRTDDGWRSRKLVLEVIW
jgi:hypothetical protein